MLRSNFSVFIQKDKIKFFYFSHFHGLPPKLSKQAFQEAKNHLFSVTLSCDPNFIGNVMLGKNIQMKNCKFDYINSLSAFMVPYKMLFSKKFLSFRQF